MGHRARRHAASTSDVTVRSAQASRPRVGVSACLLGEPVRTDGGHKRAAYLVDELGSSVEWVPVCPEVEAGLGVPRPPMRLEQAAEGPLLVEIESRRDHTEAMREYVAQRVRALRALELSGYVLKARSPSCGIRGVPLHRPDAAPRLEGRGLFAAALIQASADLPIADEEELADPERLAAFLARVIAYSGSRERGA